jgi:uncharacterized protein YyaL (SSP411 family)
VAEGIASWLATMQLPGGGFASAQDSESTVDGQRVEGFYYSLDAASRERVEPPPTDAKVLTGWNGLAIESLALAGTLLDRADWISMAARAADFLLEHHVLPSGMVRTSIGDTVSSARATLEDHGMLASGLIELAVATGEPHYAVAARSLVDDSMAAGAPLGVPFGVPGGADPVLESQGLAVPADPSDGAYPSGLSSMASAAHRLFLLTAHEPYRAAAIVARSSVAAAAVQQPVSLGAALAVMSGLAEPARQVVLVGDNPSELTAMVGRWHRSGGVAAIVSGDGAKQFAAHGFELFEGRAPLQDTSTAYVCEDFVCRLPVSSADDLARLLDVAGLRHGGDSGETPRP